MDAVVAYVPFTDGEMRPVYEALDLRQYVIDADGLHVVGVSFIPRDASDEPLVIGCAR